MSCQGIHIAGHAVLYPDLGVRQWHSLDQLVILDNQTKDKMEWQFYPYPRPRLHYIGT